MKYKNYDIKPVYFVGSTFTVTDNNQIINRKPTKKDIEYYEIIERKTNWHFCNEFTVQKAKNSIDLLLQKINQFNASV